MNEVLEKLFSNENFPIYLIIALVVLIILFIIVLFMGKKDKKEREVEATKKLQQISEDAFKEENILGKVEVPQNEFGMIEETNSLENDTMVFPVIENTQIEEQQEIIIPDPVLPVVETNPQNEEVVNENIVEEVTIQEPILNQVEEKPLVVEEVSNTYDNEDTTLLEKIEEPVLTSVPEFNFDEIMKTIEENSKNFEIQEEVKEEIIEKPVEINRGPQIFSSVYVPEKKEEIKSKELDFELPTLKKEVIQEEVKEIEQPKEEEAIITEFNLDDISGETYNIK